MKRLLIIGASILQLPAIKKAKEMGYYVGVVDFNPNAIGISFADEYFNISTNDIEGVKACAREFCPDGIMTLATDMPMRSIAAACEELQLVGISQETALKATDKGEMIKAFEEYNVPHPWYYILSPTDSLSLIEELLSFPCIAKPTDNSGSRGVVLINTIDELNDAIAYSRTNGRSGTIIIEEYLTGKEVSVEVMVINTVPHILQITDKLTTGAPHFVELGHSEPSSLSKDEKDAISCVAINACKAIGIENGPAHVEIMLTDNGPKMIELGARMGGDNITTHLVPLSTGIDMIAATIQIACGESVNIEPTFEKGSAIRFIKANKGIVKSISGLEKASTIEGVEEIHVGVKVGDQIEDINDSTDRIGYVIAQADNPHKAIDACEKALNYIKILT